MVTINKVLAASARVRGLRLGLKVSPVGLGGYGSNPHLVYIIVK